MSEGDQPTCFVAMPVATRPADIERYGGDDDHWLHVLDTIFEPALKAAGYRTIRPTVHGSHVIHAAIIENLQRADLVLCDLSSHNPNVFFELGVRTSLNLPIALVRDETTELPFDTSTINTMMYSSRLLGWEVGVEREKLTKHIVDSARSCAGENPLWRHFGLTLQASEPSRDASPLEARVDLLTAELDILKQRWAPPPFSGGKSLDREVRMFDPSERFLDSYGRARATGAHYLLFEQALLRMVSDRPGLDFVVERREAGATLRLRGPWEEADIVRMQHLADRYEVLIIEYSIE